MTSHELPKFHLPRKLEKTLAALSAYYAEKNKPLLRQLLVNSRYRVDEGTDYDNWDGGQWGHTVVFEVPPAIYYQLFDSLHEAEEELQKGINKLDKTDHEHVTSVILEIQDDPSLRQWRENSGLLLSKSPLQVPSTEDDLRRLWEPGFLRLFLSHKAKYKKHTAELKQRLLSYGVSSFVAHEDIEPTKEWQDEIEKALFSMHALVPHLTDGFHDSNWTDQEIGVAIGRGVPVIPVKLGTDPYGFIGKYQAVPGDLSKPWILAKALIDLAVTNDALKDLMKDALIARFERAESFDQANTVIQLLDNHLDAASPQQIERIEAAQETNSQVRNAFEVEKLLPRLLKRLTSRS